MVWPFFYSKKKTKTNNFVNVAMILLKIWISEFLKLSLNFAPKNERPLTLTQISMENSFFFVLTQCNRRGIAICKPNIGDIYSIPSPILCIICEQIRAENLIENQSLLSIGRKQLFNIQTVRSCELTNILSRSVTHLQLFFTSNNFLFP